MPVCACAVWAAWWGPCWRPPPAPAEASWGSTSCCTRWLQQHRKSCQAKCPCYSRYVLLLLQCSANRHALAGVGTAHWHWAAPHHHVALAFSFLLLTYVKGTWDIQHAACTYMHHLLCRPGTACCSTALTEQALGASQSWHESEGVHGLESQSAQGSGVQPRLHATDCAAQTLHLTFPAIPTIVPQSCEDHVSSMLACLLA